MICLMWFKDHNYTVPLRIAVSMSDLEDTEENRGMPGIYTYMECKRCGKFRLLDEDDMDDDKDIDWWGAGGY